MDQVVSHSFQLNHQNLDFDVICYCSPWFGARRESRFYAKDTCFSLEQTCFEDKAEAHYLSQVFIFLFMTFLATDSALVYYFPK